MPHLTLRPIYQFKFAASRVPANIDQLLVGDCMAAQASGGNFVDLRRPDLTRISRCIDPGGFLFGGLTLNVAAGLFTMTL